MTTRTHVTLMVALVLAAPAIAASQTFPGSGDAGTIASEPFTREVRSDDGRRVIGTEEMTLQLTARWSVEARGTGRLTQTLESLNMCMRMAKQGECDMKCGTPIDAPKGTGRGAYYPDAAAMREVQRLTRKQSRDLGAASLEWSDARSPVRRNFEQWVTRPVALTLEAGGSCTNTKAVFGTTVYALQLSWTYTLRTRRSVGGGTIVLPDRDAGSGSATIALGERFGTEPVQVTKKEACSCARAQPPPPTQPPVNVTGIPTFSGLGLTDEQKEEGARKWKEGREAFEEWLRQVQKKQADRRQASLPPCGCGCKGTAQPRCAYKGCGCKPPDGARFAVSRSGVAVAFTDASTTFRNERDPLTQNLGVSMTSASHSGTTPAARSPWRLTPQHALLAARSLLWAPIARGPRPPIAASFAPARISTAPPVLDDIVIALTATGRSSGEALLMRIVNRSGEAVDVDIPDGLVVQPVKNLTGAALARATGGPAIERVLTAHCLDYPKLPPATDAVYQIAPTAVQRQYQSMRSVFRAVRDLAGSGDLRPDSDAARYTEFIAQWSLWTKGQGWDESAFTRAFVERTKKSVEARSAKWTKELEQMAIAAAPNRWRDIQKVLEHARAIEAPQP
jgi:hypothetical protein